MLHKPEDLSADTPAESLLQKHKGASSASSSSSDSSGLNSQAGGASDDSENEDAEMPDPKLKAAPKRRGRPRKRPDAQQITPSPDHVSWMRSLLQDLSMPVPTESGSVESEPSVSLAAEATNLVEEAFELSSHGNHDAKKPGTDKLEEQEEQYAEEVNLESGLDEMQERERKMLAQAHEDFKDLKDKQALKSPIAEANLAHAIQEIVTKSGISEEEAAEEAMLGQHQLLGNDKQEPISEVGVSLSSPSPPNLQGLQSSSSSSRVEAAPAPQASQGPFGNWMEAWFASCEALVNAREACNTTSVGQGGELSLVMGPIKGAVANSTSASSAAGSQDPESVFWVHWSDSVARSGRPATLDKDNRVKCIVATGQLREKRDYKSVKILHPAIGVRMERVRGYAGMLRPAVPAKVLRLSDVWKEVLICRSNSSTEALGLPTSFAAAVQSECPCYVCGSSASRTSDNDEPMRFDVVRTCPLCLLAAHTACSDCVAEFAANEAFSIKGRAGPISNFIDALQGGLLREVFGDSYAMSLGSLG